MKKIIESVVWTIDDPELLEKAVVETLEANEYYFDEKGNIVCV